MGIYFHSFRRYNDSRRNTFFWVEGRTPLLPSGRHKLSLKIAASAGRAVALLYSRFYEWPTAGRFPVCKQLDWLYNEPLKKCCRKLRPYGVFQSPKKWNKWSKISSFQRQKKRWLLNCEFFMVNSKLLKQNFHKAFCFAPMRTGRFGLLVPNWTV